MVFLKNSNNKQMYSLPRRKEVHPHHNLKKITISHLAKLSSTAFSLLHNLH